jgi:uncharacterized protein
MPIKNETKKKVLTKKAKFCKTILSKSIGLMFHSKLKDNALIFVYEKESKVSLHMAFVFFPIDVMYLDENKRVIELKKGFKPFTVYVPSKKSNYVVELPEKTIEKTCTEIGDKIVF